jgi:hypothetical protein
VNKGKRKGRGCYAPALAPFSVSNRYSVASCTTKLPLEFMGTFRPRF